MTSAALKLTLTAPIAEITLIRAGDGNPIDAALVAELDRACETIADRDDLQVVLLTSNGSAFSVDGSAACSALLRKIELLPQPVIAAIEGQAIGAGLELALACDIRIASENATFAMPQTAGDEIPSAGGTQRLPRLIGRTRAAEMILLGTTIDAATALAYGLVNHVVPPGQARPRAIQLAETIARQGPIAVRYAKEAILRGLDMPLEQALRYETDLTVILQTTADRAEGVAAFLEKRRPNFDGK